MSFPLQNACAADVPIVGLAVLAGLRTRSEVTALMRGERVWVRWPAAADEVRTCLLPVPGVAVFVRHGEHWYRLGSRLPCAGLPTEAGVALAAVLTPAALDLEPGPTRPLAPVRLTLVRDRRPRPVRALSAPLTELGHWAETAPTASFAGLEAAVAGDLVVVRGEPSVARMALAGAVRFWGRTLLMPLGFQSEPALPDSALAGALGLRVGDAGLLTEQGLEVVPAECFGPLTRAGVRLGLRGRA